MANEIESLEIRIESDAQKAIKNITTLDSKLNGFLTTLQKANSIGLSGLSGSIGKVNNTSSKLHSNIAKTNRSFLNLKKSTFSLASAFGKFYASYFLVIRGMKALWGAIENTGDYMESLNYFTVAFDKIAGEWNQDFEKWGYENAEAYAESFTERMSDTFSKLSGIRFNQDKGLLEYTDTKNLGLDINQITQYTAQLASMTNAVGQVGEVSLATAESMALLAGDISSLFNINYETAGNKIQSVLQGQARAGYAFGWDTTVASLQKYADELDLSKAISEMSQMEKQQLRILAILDQSRVAWGNQSREIDTLSNQIRLFKTNLSEAGMTLGQLFLPILTKVLPVVNGLTIAFKRFTVNLAEMFGISIDTSFGSSLGSLSEDAYGISDGLDSAVASAKKLKTVTLGIDELNINAPQEDTSASGGGIGGSIDLSDEIVSATEEYKKAWQEAFDKMESRALKFADSFAHIFAPVEDIFRNISIGDWFAVGEGIGELSNNIFTFFSDAIKGVNWTDVGNNIGDFLAGINWLEDVIKPGLELAGDISEAIKDVWFGAFETAPIETVLITTFGLMNLTPLGGIVLGKIGTAITGSLASMGGIGGLLTMDYALLGAASFGEAAVWLGSSFVAAIGTAIAGFELGKVLGKWLTGDKEAYDNFTWFGEGGFFPTLSEMDFLEIIESFNGFLLYIQEEWDNFKEENFEKVKSWVSDTGKKFGEFFKNTVDSAKTWVSDMGIKVGQFSYNTGQKFDEWKTNSALKFSGFVEDSKNKFEAFKADATTKITNFGIDAGKKFGEFRTNTFATLSGWYENSKNKIDSFRANSATFFSNFKSNAITTVSQFGTQTYNKISGWYNDTIEFFGIDEWSFEGIKQGLSNSFESAIEAIKNIWNSFANWLNSKLTFSWDAVTIAGREVVPGGSITLGSIPTFQTGGFPEDGLFMANRGELVGQFSNGRTAVANNEQIVEGIEGGVERAVERVLAPYLSEIARNTRETADKDTAINIGDRAIARANARGLTSMGRPLMSTT